MPHYLFTASYTTEGIKGVLKEGGSARLKAVGELVKGAGGTIETAYWAFGDPDFLIIAELPDNTAAAALATHVAATGSASVQTTVLLTAAELDAAAKTSVTYRPPGG